MQHIWLVLKDEGLCFHNGGYFSPQRISKKKIKKKELLLLFTLLSVAWAFLDSSAEAIG
jgi:hypothetical protein